MPLLDRRQPYLAGDVVDKVDQHLLPGMSNFFGGGLGEGMKMN